MPTLRFARDRRGYESTYLVHAPARRPGVESSLLLYWFRSPPHVKIGRAAFDEDAIRALEEQHPDVEFDWDRILTTKPPAAPEAHDPREARSARRPERRPIKDVRRETPRPVPVAPPAPASAPSAPEPSGPVVGATTVPVPPPASRPVESVGENVAATAGAEPVPSGPPPRRFVRVYDAPPASAEEPVHHASELSVVERMLGAEQLTVLRARYAEILARISARGGDPQRVQTLRDRAATIDPDGWVTEGEVTAGLAAVEPTLAELHQVAGRRRRRRRRRRDARPPVPPGADAVEPTGADHDNEDEPEGPDPA